MPESPANPLREEIADLVRRERGITFARFMELALYHPALGYYRSAHRRPGREGDFITAPELHPLFGLALARHVLEAIDGLGPADPFVIREYGAGIGGLAYDILAGVLDARPEMRPRLRYELIEVNDHRRAQAMQAMTEVGLADVVNAMAAVPPEPIEGIVIANEVADALPVHRLVARGGRLREAWVTLDGDVFAWDERDLSPAVAHVPEYLARHGIAVDSLPEGSVIEPAPAVGAWIGEIAGSLRRGTALIIDYGYPVTELLREHRLRGTLRGHARHTVNEDPFRDIGAQDLTAHVDFTALGEAAERNGMRIDGLTTQGDFLARIGLGELLVAMQHQEGMDHETYFRAQAAVYRLIDPGGMGRFRVIGLAKGFDRAEPPRGFIDWGLHL